MRFYTSQDIPANLAKRSFAASLFRRFPGSRNGAPLFALTGMAKENTISNTSHGYWAKTAIFPKFSVTAAATTSATTLTVASTLHIKVNSVYRYLPPANAGVYVPPEFILVTAVPSSTTLTVQRGFAGSTGLAIPIGALFIEVGSSYEQGSLLPSSRSILPEYFVNNTQIFRDAWDCSGTLAAIEMETGYNSQSENKADAAYYHAQNIETSLFFGKLSAGVRNGRPFTTMDGIEQTVYKHAPSNIREAGATTNFDQLEEMLDPLLDVAVDGRSSNSRSIFCGKDALRVINNIGKKSGQYQLEEKQTAFGARFHKFTTTRGDFELMEHPLFNTNPEWAKMAAVIDLPSFDVNYLRKTKHETVAFNGTDAVSGVYTTELTSTLLNPAACGFIYNLRQAAI